MNWNDCGLLDLVLDLFETINIICKLYVSCKDLHVYVFMQVVSFILDPSQDLHVHIPMFYVRSLCYMIRSICSYASCKFYVRSICSYVSCKFYVRSTCLCSYVHMQVTNFMIGSMSRSI